MNIVHTTIWQYNWGAHSQNHLTLAKLVSPIECQHVTLSTLAFVTTMRVVTFPGRGASMQVEFAFVHVCVQSGIQWPLCGNHFSMPPQPGGN